MAESRQLLKDSMYALGAVALWGLAFPLIQIGLEDFSPIMLGFLRFVLASALMLVFIVVMYSFEQVAATVRKEWKPLLILGLLYVTIPNIAQNIGLQSGTILLGASGGISLQDEDFTSNVFILMSATSYGLAWVSAKRMLERNPPVLIIGLSLAFGTLLLGAVVPFEPGL